METPRGCSILAWGHLYHEEPGVDLVTLPAAARVLGLSADTQRGWRGNPRGAGKPGLHTHPAPDAHVAVLAGTSRLTNRDLVSTSVTGEADPGSPEGPHTVGAESKVRSGWLLSC